MTFQSSTESTLKKSKSNFKLGSKVHRSDEEEEETPDFDGPVLWARVDEIWATPTETSHTLRLAS